MRLMILKLCLHGGFSCTSPPQHAPRRNKYYLNAAYCGLLRLIEANWPHSACRWWVWSCHGTLKQPKTIHLRAKQHGQQGVFKPLPANYNLSSPYGEFRIVWLKSAPQPVRALYVAGQREFYRAVYETYGNLLLKALF